MECEILEKLPSFSTTVLQHDTFKAILNNKTYGNNTRKHLVQSASLLGHLEQAGLVQDDTCFIEFGAGKGIPHLSLKPSIEFPWIIMYVKDVTKKRISI